MTVAFLTGYSIAAFFCAAWWARGFYLATRAMNADLRHEETSQESWEKAKKLRRERPILFGVVVVGTILCVAVCWPIWLGNEILSKK